MKKQLVENIFKKAKSAKIAVIGDFCLDVYWFVNEIASEKSLETGLFTLPINRQEYSLGGAGNIVNNLHALGCTDLQAFGVIGNDLWGEKLMQKLNEIDINSEGIIIQGKHWDTPSYVKPYKDNIELNRIDFGNFNNLDKETLNCLLSILEKNLQNQDIVIISQQIARCLFVDEFIKKLLILMNKFCDTLFIVDSRHYGDCFPNAILKINDFIAETMVGNYDPDGVDVKRENVIKTAKILKKKLNKTIFITRGKNGCIVVDEGEIKEISSIKPTGKFDTVGAGDSMLISAAMSFASGASAWEAACIGSLASSVQVGRVGNLPLKKEDLLFNIS